MKGIEGSLTKDLKYWEIYKDVMVLTDGCFVPVIGLELPSSDLQSSTELDRYNEILSQMMRYATPEGEPLTLIIHTRKIDTAIMQAYQQHLTAKEKIAQTLTDDRITHLQALQSSGRLFEHRAYLSTVYRPSRKRRKIRLINYWGEKISIKALHERNLSNDVATRISSEISSCATASKLGLKRDLWQRKSFLKCRIVTLILVAPCQLTRNRVTTILNGF
jgi:predicted transcriptional regulator